MKIPVMARNTIRTKVARALHTCTLNHRLKFKPPFARCRAMVPPRSSALLAGGGQRGVEGQALYMSMRRKENSSCRSNSYSSLPIELLNQTARRSDDYRETQELPFSAVDGMALKDDAERPRIMRLSRRSCCSFGGRVNDLPQLAMYLNMATVRVMATA